MSTYVLMRILESTPRRYDLGIAILTLGAVGRAYDRLADHIEPGQRVLDVGCGTGALSIRAALRGARVTGVDIDPRMLELAAERARAMQVEERVLLRERGVAELDREPGGEYDAVTCGLCLSELSAGELDFALEQCWRLLRSGGLLLAADETRTDDTWLRWLTSLLRAPLAALTYVVAQRTSHAIVGLPDRLRARGFELLSVRRSSLGSFIEVVARRP